MIGPTISKCTPLAGNHRRALGGMPRKRHTSVLRHTPPANTTNLPSHPRDDPARERLGHAPSLVDADGEHQFLKTLTLELADLLDQRLGRADQAGGADEAGVDQLGFPRVQIGVVELVRAEMPMRGGRLLHECAVALPDRTQEFRGLDAPLLHLVVEVVDAGLTLGPTVRMTRGNRPARPAPGAPR